MSLAERDLPEISSPKEIPQFVASYVSERQQAIEARVNEAQRGQGFVTYNNEAKVYISHNEELLEQWKRSSADANVKDIGLRIDFRNLFDDVKSASIAAPDLKAAGANNWVTQQTSQVENETVTWHVILKGKTSDQSQRMAIYVEGAHSYLDLSGGKAVIREIKSTPSLEFENVDPTRVDLNFYRKTLDSRVVKP